MIDLQIHSHYSDGSMSPTDLVRKAKKLDIYAIALTDHDTIDGIDEFMKEGKKVNLITIPGVELSVDSDLPPQGELHILGLFIDPENDELRRNLQYLQIHRNQRAKKITDKFKKLGIDISYEELLIISGGGSIGRPHLAKILIDKGIVHSLQEAFQRYLRRGGPAYVEKIKFPEAEAIQMIKNAGGLAMIAHPYLMKLPTGKQIEAKILQLQKLGLDGLEAYYPGLKKEKIDYLIQLAQNFNLGVSGGSDYHGDNREGIMMGKGYGDLHVPNTVYHDLFIRWKNSRKDDKKILHKGRI